MNNQTIFRMMEFAYYRTYAPSIKGWCIIAMLGMTLARQDRDKESARQFYANARLHLADVVRTGAYRKSTKRKE
jgi:hypothetical protein